MESAAWTLIVELLEVGGALTRLWQSMIEDMSEDNFPGEALEAVLLEIMVGSAFPALRRAGPKECRHAAGLIESVHDRVVGDLRLALEIAERRD